MSDLELSIESRALKAVLARAAGAAGTRSAMPILACCLLEATDATLTVTTSDSFVSERSHAAIVAKHGGALCVDARTFTDMVKQLPVGEVKLKQVGTSLQIRCGKILYKLPSMPGEDFPPMPSVENAVPVVSLASDVLLRLIGQGAYALSQDDTRPHLAGMLMEFANDTATVVSTDGHRLALASVNAAHGAAAKLLVPAKGIAELKKLCASADQVTIRRSGKLLLLTTEDTTVIVTTNDETFPPYAKVIPNSYKHRVTLSRELLMDAVKRVSLIAGKSLGGGLRLQFGDGELSISAESAEAGEAHESLECDSTSDLRIGLSGRYLEQALAALSSDDVALELLGELDPIVCKGIGDENATGVLMPQRIS